MGIAKDEDLAASAMGAKVTSPGDAKSLLRTVDADPPVPLHQTVGAAIRGEIVHDNHLTGSGEAGEQALHGALQVLPLVVAYHDHTEVRSAR
jgi:hypothetical protein